MLGAGTPDHRVREPPLLVEPEVAFAPESSGIECAAKNSGVTRARVASLATALAPFSQNSAVLRSSSGSGQAQLGQSKPSF